VLLIKTGSVAPALAAMASDYELWFRAALPTSVDIELVQAHLGEPLPELKGFDAVLTTGSPLSVTEDEPWMEPCGHYLLNAAERGVPVLAICFGHQLVARVLGGKVERNPRGREIGTVQVQLTADGKASPIFAGLPTQIGVQATHVDAVTRLPYGARLLGENDFGIQSFSVGERLWAVQFHPEMGATQMTALIRSREEILRKENRFERALASVQESAHGRTILSNALHGT
jgi:GMP synthase (glutamine-hydrolysing)